MSRGEKERTEALTAPTVREPDVQGLNARLSPSSAQRFERALAEAIQLSFRSVLGESVAAGIWFHLEKNSSKTREELVGDPGTFHTELERVFGAGAITLENLILKALFSALDIARRAVDVRYRDFADQVRGAKEQLEKQDRSSRFA